MLLQILTALIIVNPTVLAVDLKAVFSMSGINGSVMFTQTADGSPTTITIDLDGINETLSWAIHEIPMIYNGNAAFTCNPDAVGDIYNPLGKMKNCSQSQKVNCAYGDLKGKFGSLNASSKGSSFMDSNLTLTGYYSINGRTLVLSNGAKPKACALITVLSAKMSTAVAVLKGPIAGTIYFRQEAMNKDTSVFVKLFFVSNVTTNVTYGWRIASRKVGDDFSISARCQNAGPTFNPKGVQKSECTTVNQQECAVGDLTRKHKNISVGSASIPSFQAAFTDTNLQLAGVDSVIGRSLVIYNLNNQAEAIACADIRTVKPRQAVAVFKAETDDNVEGNFTFTQDSPFDITTTTINIKGLAGKAEGYHVHDYMNPIYNKVNGSEACSNAVAGGHWNPFGIIAKQSPPAGTGTDDQYEIGDLSNKYGSFKGKTSYESTHQDFNLPLFGKNSIILRSMVIHNPLPGNKRWVCSNIMPVAFGQDLSMYVLKAKAVFTGPILSGTVFFMQTMIADEQGTKSDTWVMLDVSHTDNPSNQTPKHNWHVHINPVGNDGAAETGRCQSVLGHFNPFNVYVEGNYKATCTPDKMLRCEVGDLSAKHQQYDIGSKQRFYTDIDAPLFGTNSIVGRSVTFHTENGGAPRLACADIVPSEDNYSNKSLTFSMDPAQFSKNSFVNTVAEALGIPSWRLAYVRESKDNEKNCMTATFAIVGSDQQRIEVVKKFDKMLRETPDDFKGYAPVVGCGKSSNSPRVNMNSKLTVLLVLVALISDALQRRV